ATRQQSVHCDYPTILAGELIDLPEQFFRLDQDEIIFGAADEFVIVAQGLARVLNRQLELTGHSALAVNRQVLRATEEARVGCDRNIDMLINEVAEDGAAPLLHPDNAHRDTADLELFANRVRVGEELVFDVCAEHGHKLAVLDFGRINKTTFCDRLILDIKHVRRHAEDDRALESFPVLLELRAASDLRADGAACAT